MNLSGAGGPALSAHERRRERERRRRMQVRRRRRFAALALVALVAGVVAAIAGGGSSRPRALGPHRAVVSMHVGRVSALAAPVQDAAVASVGHATFMLGGIDAAGNSTAAIVPLAATARPALAARLPQVQHDAQAATLGGRIYVFGGGDVASYDHILRFDPRSGAVTVAGTLPRAQSDVGVATIGATAFVVGGFDGVAPLDTIVAWSPGQPAHVVARLPFALRYAAVVAVDGRLIIAGGTMASGVSDAILSYDPADGTVLQVGVLPAPVTHAAAVLDGGRIYLIGGRRTAAGAQTAQVVEIDPVSDLATVVGGLPAPLSDAAVALDGERILVAGGERAGGITQSAVLALTPRVREVAVRAVAPKLLARRELAKLDSLGFGEALRAHPSSLAPYEAASAKPGLPGYLLIADRGNDRILVVNPQGHVVWRFPNAADVAAGRLLHFNDDTFVQPGGRSLIVNEEDYGTVVSIGIASHRIHLLFGVPGKLGGGPTEMNYPDDAYAYPDGSFTVADAYNCRILFVRDHRIVHQYGTSGVCAHNPPQTFGAVNGDTPTPYGGVLVSEIPGHWIDAINANGTLRWSLQAPVAYPSDPQPLPHDRVLLADYSTPGHILIVDRYGHVSWRYGPPSGQAALNQPSLALQLPNGDIAVNDDYRDRVLVIDPRTNRIVWQYGHTDVPGRGPGYLHTPDGMDFIPAGPNGQPDWAAVVHP